MADGRHKERNPKGAVAEWPTEKLEEHRRMLRQRQVEIQGRIDAIELILEDRNDE